MSDTTDYTADLPEDSVEYVEPDIDPGCLPDLEEDTADYGCEDSPAEPELIQEIPEDIPDEPLDFPEEIEEVPEGPAAGFEEITEEEPEFEEVESEEVAEESEEVPADEGEDTPEEQEAPDYFADQERAADVMSGFKPDIWESLSIEEQKGTVENLADYSLDALGIENKPSVEYYTNDDPTDFGYYDPKTNTINVNDANMEDAAETADTIAHESRHCFQHMRAQNPQNEQDEEFRDSFDNYIDPDIDRQGYRDQLVERDAREYADRFREFIKGT